MTNTIDTTYALLTFLLVVTGHYYFHSGAVIIRFGLGQNYNNARNPKYCR